MEPSGSRQIARAEPEDKLELTKLNYFMICSSGLAVLLIIPCFILREWYIEQGIVDRRLGLFYVEVLGCAAAPKVQFASKISKAPEWFALQLCAAFSGEGDSGVFDWASYMEDSCKMMAENPYCMAVTMGGISDIGIYCAAAQANCGGMGAVKHVNLTTLFLMVLSIWLTISSAAYSLYEGNFCVVLIFSTLFPASIVATLYNYYSSTALLALTDGDSSKAIPGAALSLLATAGVLGCLQIICVILYLGDHNEESDCSSSGSGSEDSVLHGKKLLKSYEAQDVSQQRPPQSAYAVQGQQQYVSQQCPPQSAYAVQGQQQNFNGIQNNPDSAMADAYLARIYETLQSKSVSSWEQAFSGFDTNADGYIAAHEFSNGIYMLCPDLGQAEVQWLHSYMDPNRDGYVDYHEFVNKMTRFG